MIDFELSEEGTKKLLEATESEDRWHSWTGHLYRCFADGREGGMTLLKADLWEYVKPGEVCLWTDHEAWGSRQMELYYERKAKRTPEQIEWDKQKEGECNLDWSRRAGKYEQMKDNE